MTEGAGPLEEIQFWKARCDDLSGLTRQLDQAGVGRVISVMEKAKSSYLPPFTKLSKQIQVRGPGGVGGPGGGGGGGGGGGYVLQSYAMV